MTNINSWQPTEVISPSVDVYKVEDKVCIVLMIPGASAKDLDINFHKNTFTVKGICNKPYNNNEVALLSECKWGPFEREILINENLDVENIKAVLNHGLLTIEVPIFKILETKKIELSNN
jgi:HSP20 family protein